MTELSASLAPRNQMKSSFFPLRPIEPSASARLITNGISTRVDRATARLVFTERSKKLRRVMILQLQVCIILLFLETLQGHQPRHHPSNSPVVRIITRPGISESAERGKSYPV